MSAETLDPRGESRGSDAERVPLANAMRDALAAVQRFRQGEIDGLALSRWLVNDEPLREIVPIRLLIGFIGVEAQFGADPDEEHVDPVELVDLRAEREELLAEAHESLTRDCDVLAAHLEQWQRTHPSSSADG